MDAGYLAAQESRLLGSGATESGRLAALNDLIFSFRVYPVEADDPLVTVHDVLENVLASSPASVVATSFGQVSGRFTSLAGPSHDQIFQLLVTPWLAELRVAVVRRGSPSVALAFFDLWADVLVSARERRMPGFYAHSARPFVASLRHVAHAGLFEEAGGRVLRPLVRVMGASGADLAALGPWAGALVAWMREDAEKFRGEWTRTLWNPVETVFERALEEDVAGGPLLGALVHGLTGVARAAGRAGLETGGGTPFALKIATRMRRAQIELAASPPTETVRDRIALLGEPIAAVVALASVRPELAGAPALLSSERLPDERDGEA